MARPGYYAEVQIWRYWIFFGCPLLPLSSPSLSPLQPPSFPPPPFPYLPPVPSPILFIPSVFSPSLFLPTLTIPPSLSLLPIPFCLPSYCARRTLSRRVIRGPSPWNGGPGASPPKKLQLDSFGSFWCDNCSTEISAFVGEKCYFAKIIQSFL